MLSNTITLAVDPTGANTTTVDEILNRFKELENKTQYRFSDHTLTARNQLEIYRNDIAPSGNYLGNAKGSIKLTEDQIVLAKDGSNIVAPTIYGLTGSIPVGTSDESFYHNLGRLQALVLNTALMYKIFMQQDI